MSKIQKHWVIDRMGRGGKHPIVNLGTFYNFREATEAWEKIVPDVTKSHYLARVQDTGTITLACK